MTTATVQSDNESLAREALLARGWAALPASYRIPDVAPHAGRGSRLLPAPGRVALTKISMSLRGFCPRRCVRISMLFTPTAASPTISATKWATRRRRLRCSIYGGRELDACYAGSARHPVFVALGETIRACSIPKEPFADLLTAFRQDQVVTRFATMGDVLGYCRYSANPVGRLVLYACGEANAERFPSLGRDMHRTATGQFLAGCAGGLHARGASIFRKTT